MSIADAVVHRTMRGSRAFKITASDSNYFVFTADPLVDQVGFVQVIEVFEVGGATPPNRHARADEIFYVLHGEGMALCNGARLAVGKGDSFLVRAGHEHLVENTGPSRLYCLTTMVPDEDFAALIRGGLPWPLDEADMLVLAN
jgi:mannose-6-phosphate isomerase-like protein (cupin superfamily)